MDPNFFVCLSLKKKKGKRKIISMQNIILLFGGVGDGRKDHQFNDFTDIYIYLFI